MFGTNNGIAGQVLVSSGTDEQKRRWLPRLAAGEVASFALTEAEAGSDPSGPDHERPTRDGDGYVISGAKRFITNAPVADLFVLFARTDPQRGDPRHLGVPRRGRTAPGSGSGPGTTRSASPARGPPRCSSTRSGSRCRRLVGGQEGAGFGEAMKSLVRGRVHIAALCVGMAERLLDESVAYARNSKQGGQPIGEFQLVQAMLADIQTGAYAGRAMVLEAARNYDSGRGPQDRAVGGEAVLLGDGRPGGRPGGADPRRPRLHARRPGRADVPRRPAVPHLRGHERDPAGSSSAAR